MSEKAVTEETASLDIRNVGGIPSTTVTFTPGVTVLEGRNATNRTSLLQAIMAALGSENVSLKADADEGRAELSFGRETYVRELERKNETVVTTGEPYSDDPSLLDSFAFLLETNDARQAVARGEDLRNVIMEPIDTAKIEEQIEELQSRRSELESEMEEISRIEDRIPSLQKEKSELGRQIDEKKSRLEEIREEISEIDTDIEEKKNHQGEFESKMENMNEKRKYLQSVIREIESQRESISALETERAELEEDKEACDEIPENRLESIEDEIDDLRREKRRVERKYDEIQTVIQFNEGLLEGSLDVFGDTLPETQNAAVTEQLVDEAEVVTCWTCGSDVEKTQIEETLVELRGLRNQQMSEQNELDEAIEELEKERREIDERRQRRDRIERQLETVTGEIRSREDRLDELESRRSNLRDEVETLEASVEDLQADADRDELLELHEEANRIEIEIERLVSEREEVTEEIEQLRNRIEELPRLERRRDEIADEITELRTRVERIENDAVEEFNEHMESVLDILEYDNLERIWVERTERQVRDGRKNVTEGRFVLHVVRSTSSGTVYEDTVDHLSESEREVTGLIFALAGYLAHEVYEDVPFMLLDSLEAIDASRIGALIEYFGEYADYLVVALLEEDARALEGSYDRITDI